MELERALALKPGDKVACPADRGSPAYTGEVRHVGKTVSETIGGRKYVWVTVRNRYCQESVWPSNRLG